MNTQPLIRKISEVSGLSSFQAGLVADFYVREGRAVEDCETGRIRMRACDLAPTMISNALAVSAAGF